MSDATPIRKARRAETHSKLEHAVAAELVEFGFAGANIERIVRSVGLTRGAFYNHFESLEDAAVRIVADEVDQELSELEAIMESNDASSLDSFVAALSGSRDWTGPLFNAGPGQSFISLTELFLALKEDDPLRATIFELFDRRMRVFERLLEWAVDTFGLTFPTSPRHLARLISATEIGLHISHRAIPDDEFIPSPGKIGTELVMLVQWLSINAARNDGES